MEQGFTVVLLRTATQRKVKKKKKLLEAFEKHNLLPMAVVVTTYHVN